jgi:hypothetical protein
VVVTGPPPAAGCVCSALWPLVDAIRIPPAAATPEANSSRREGAVIDLAPEPAARILQRSTPGDTHPDAFPRPYKTYTKCVVKDNREAEIVDLGECFGRIDYQGASRGFHPFAPATGKQKQSVRLCRGGRRWVVAPGTVSLNWTFDASR